jgi:hypothetical protein
MSFTRSKPRPSHGCLGVAAGISVAGGVVVAVGIAVYLETRPRRRGGRKASRRSTQGCRDGIENLSGVAQGSGVVPSQFAVHGDDEARAAGVRMSPSPDS